MQPRRRPHAESCPASAAPGGATLEPPSTGLPAAPSGAAGSLPEQFGRYRILRRLGAGAMGSVYLAQDTQLDRPVALKVSAFTPGGDRKTFERFRREAKAAAQLHHANLCPVYDVGQVDGVHYLCMAYVDGTPLAAALRRGQPWPAHRAAALVRQVASGLAHAHRLGVIHRDLKPSNIMLREDGDPVVVDFGLARRTDEDGTRLTRAGEVMGTPAYMPPEQVQGDVAAMGPGCDIYSLGVILYELLTGQRPFQGSVESILAEILTRQPRPPAALRPGLDPQLNAICLKAMAKRVHERFHSMDALMAALTEYLRTADRSGAQPAAARSRRSLPSAESPPSASWWLGVVAVAAASLLFLAVLVPRQVWQGKGWPEGIDARWIDASVFTAEPPPRAAPNDDERPPPQPPARGKKQAATSMVGD